MNTFRTVIPPSNFPFKISHNDAIICIGSCFTENIGQFLTNAKFSTLVNPFGIVYNPISIAKVLAQIVDNSEVDESTLVSLNGRYYHWDFHGDLSGTNPDATVDLLNHQIDTANKYIQRSDVLFLTLGTANAFQLIGNDHIVANCHKFPNDQFRRVALSVDVMVDKLQSAITKLGQIDPSKKIVFTVSPVRHIRDGLINNQLSKAKLIQTVHQLCDTNECVHYFPSYELIMDDLRDYRFYKNDMLHVNESGLAYIWDYFRKSFFTDETAEQIDSISRIQKDLAHKPFYPNSDQHQSFLQQIRIKIEQLTKRVNQLDFEAELQSIDEQINS